MQRLGFIGLGTLILYIVIGLVQIFAIAAGVKVWLGIESEILALILAVLLTYIPIVGSILGVVGAVQLWGWPVILAILLFFGWLIFFLVVGLFLLILAALGLRQR